MTRNEARIVLLEQALEQAQNTVEFLHGCLTEPGLYEYLYPDQTLRRLREWASLAPRGPGCAHSVTHADCESCAGRVERARRYEEAERTLASDVAQGERRDDGVFDEDQDG